MRAQPLEYYTKRLKWVTAVGYPMAVQITFGRISYNRTRFGRTDGGFEVSIRGFYVTVDTS